MKVSYAVTFEFVTNPPITQRGTVEGGSARTCSFRAITEAVKKNPNLSWNSMSILLQKED